MPALVTRRIALRTLLGSAAAVAALGVIACTPKTEVTVAGPGQQTGITFCASRAARSSVHHGRVSPPSLTHLVRKMVSPPT